MRSNTALCGFAAGTLIAVALTCVSLPSANVPSPPLAVSRNVVASTVAWLSSRLKPATTLAGWVSSAALGIGDNDVTVIGSSATTRSSRAPSVIH